MTNQLIKRVNEQTPALGGPSAPIGRSAQTPRARGRAGSTRATRRRATTSAHVLAVVGFVFAVAGFVLNVAAHLAAYVAA